MTGQRESSDLVERVTRQAAAIAHTRPAQTRTAGMMLEAANEIVALRAQRDGLAAVLQLTRDALESFMRFSGATDPNADPRRSWQWALDGADDALARARGEQLAEHAPEVRP